MGGSAPDEDYKPQSKDEQLLELMIFDEKIYKAQAQMNEAMSAKLKSLGVPFFGTPSDLILSDTETVHSSADTQSKWSPKITSTQLLALKRRMISYLEDMYKG